MKTPSIRRSLTSSLLGLDVKKIIEDKSKLLLSTALTPVYVIIDSVLSATQAVRAVHSRIGATVEPLPGDPHPRLAKYRLRQKRYWERYRTTGKRVVYSKGFIPLNHFKK